MSKLAARFQSAVPREHPGDLSGAASRAIDRRRECTNIVDLRPALAGDRSPDRSCATGAGSVGCRLATGVPQPSPFAQPGVA